MEHKLGIGFLKQGAPKFAILGRVHVQQFPIGTRQPVVDDHVHPLTVVPELKVENTGVVVGETLIRWADARKLINFLIKWIWNIARHRPKEELITQCQTCRGGQQPTVTKFSLNDIETSVAFDEQLRLLADFLVYKKRSTVEYSSNYGRQNSFIHQDATTRYDTRAVGARKTATSSRPEIPGPQRAFSISNTRPAFGENPFRLSVPVDVVPQVAGPVVVEPHVWVLVLDLPVPVRV